MPFAYVLINVKLGSEAEAREGINKVEGMEEAHTVYGVYDIVVRIEAETLQQLKDTISTKIRTLENVRSTLTMIVV